MRTSTRLQQLLFGTLKSIMEPICLLAFLPWYLIQLSCMGRFRQHKTLNISRLSGSLQHHLLSSRLLHMVCRWHINDPLGCIGQIVPLSDFHDSMMLGCKQCNKNDTSFFQLMFAYCVCNDKLPWFVGYTTLITFFCGSWTLQCIQIILTTPTLIQTIPTKVQFPRQLFRATLLL